MARKTGVAQGAGPRTSKYLTRQEAILRAAVGVLNKKGLMGTTLGEVADHFDMVPTGVAYYFRSKEALAKACFQRTIETHTQLIVAAGAELTFEGRLTSLVHGYFDLLRRVALGEADDVALFEDIRALEDEDLEAAYVELFRQVRRLFYVGAVHTLDRVGLNARAHFLLQQLIWSRYWLRRYEPEAYARAADRLLDILLNGLGSKARSWSPAPLIVIGARATPEDDARETFLRAATQLITERGYRGASVERIAARLEVTKGSFYYYIDAKDDLIEICYRRTIEVMRRTQQAADRLDADNRQRLTSTLTYLIDHQLQGDAPLLRFATVSLPETIRTRIQADQERNNVHFGSMVSDGIADGSIRPVDVYIAGQMLTATAIAGSELVNWLPGPADDATTESFVSPLFDGLAAPQFWG
jgi:AcrR family transcriptional regulator